MDTSPTIPLALSSFLNSAGSLNFPLLPIASLPATIITMRLHTRVVLLVILLSAAYAHACDSLSETYAKIDIIVNRCESTDHLGLLTKQCIATRSSNLKAEIAQKTSTCLDSEAHASVAASIALNCAAENDDQDYDEETVRSLTAAGDLEGITVRPSCGSVRGCRWVCCAVVGLYPYSSNCSRRCR